MVNIVPTIRIRGWQYLVALEEQRPGIFVSCSEEPLQGLVSPRIKLPKGALSALAREDPANQHHLDYIDKFDVLVHHALNARLQRYQLVR